MEDCNSKFVLRSALVLLSVAVVTTTASSRQYTNEEKSKGANTKPHIISILQDDLGYYDSGVHCDDCVPFTKNISQLAQNGIILENHYSHWHCSPTRRSFLSGRLPIHHGEQLSANSGDDIDLRMEWISMKLKKAGYNTHWYGKEHTGFRSFNHLGYMNGFDTTLGSLQTGGDYSGPGHTTRWQNDHPIYKDEQFTNRPAGCSDPASDGLNLYTKLLNDDQIGISNATCDSSTWFNNTSMQCSSGGPTSFFNLSTAGECCAQCLTDPTCTHWVFEPTIIRSGDCHVKRGNYDCKTTKTGSTSGLGHVSPTPPTPPPPPPGPPGSNNATCTDEYSTDLWGQGAIQAVAQFDASTNAALYVHLCFEAVHVPYDKAPGDPTNNIYHGLLWRADVFIGELISLLKHRDMYDNTLIVYAADNGGADQGINYPLRGEKHSNWEGGMRVAAFVSGGFIPTALRGTRNGITTHVVDWYATFSFLAGQDPTNNPPVAPLPVDPSKPFKNIYGNNSFPPVDGVNVWQMLMTPANYQNDSAHEYLVLSKEVVIAGRWKLLVAQPYFKKQQPGWKYPNGSWVDPVGDEVVPCIHQDVPPNVSMTPVAYNGLPCLFDIRADKEERHNVAADNLDVVKTLWTQLNLTVLGLRDCNGWSYQGTGHGIPGPLQPDGTTSCSPPDLIGHCDSSCAEAKWKWYGSPDGPICDVPGCTNATK